MKREATLWSIGLICAFLFFLGSLYLERVEKEGYQRIYLRFQKYTYEKLQRENAQKFLDTHKDLLSFINQKSWFTPPHRLLAYDILKDLGRSLTHLQMTFEPEGMIRLSSSNEGRRTKIILTCEAPIDIDIYIFFQKLLQTFPGILLPQTLTLERISSTSTPPLSPHTSSISATLILDWITAGKTDDLP